LLSDYDINKLEQVLFSAHRQEALLLVGKWLPVLFVELRLARGALQEKAIDFFGGPPDDPAELPSDDPGPDQEGDDRGLPRRDDVHGGPEEVVPVAEEPRPDPAPDGGGRSVEAKAPRKRAKPRRDRKAAGPYEGLVVPGGDGQPVGGEEVSPVRGGGEGVVPLAQEVSNRSCTRCGVVRGTTGVCPACGCPEFSLTKCIEGQLPLPVADEEEEVPF